MNKLKLSICIGLFLAIFSEVQSQVIVGTYEAIDSIIIDDGLVQGADQMLYGTNYNGGNVYRILPNGSVEQFATGMNAPNGLDFDSQGNLFVADNLDHKIVKITPNGMLSDFVTGIIRPSGVLKMPNSDTLIVSSYSQNLILKLAPDGNLDTISQAGLLSGPVGLAFDENGNLFTGNFNNRRIIHINEDGSQSLFSQFPGPGYLGFMTYANGYFFGTGFDTHKIFKIRKSDTLISKLAGFSIGNTDGDTSVALFNKPNGVAFNQTKDTLFISDYGSGNVRFISGISDLVHIQDLALETMSLKLFPNPSQENIQVLFSIQEAKQGKLHLLNAEGKRIKSQDFNANQGTNQFGFNTNDLMNGSYFIELQFANQSFLKKFIKIK